MKNLFWKSKSLWGGLLLLYIFLSFGNVFTSCSDDEKTYPYLSNKWMIVASDQVTVMTGEETNVHLAQMKNVNWSIFVLLLILMWLLLL